MVNRLVSLLCLAISFYLGYKYRYRIINITFKKPWIRRFLLGLAMQIPYVREQMLNTIFTNNRAAH